jgi:hypothetical protein
MPDAATHYRSAVESAEAGERWLVVLARTAESQGLAAVAIEAWLRLIDDPRLAVEAARELSRLAAPLDDLTPMRRAVTRLSEFFNEDDSFAAERATLDLLFGENPARPTGVLERLCGRSDPRPEWRAGLALARAAVRAFRPRGFGLRLRLGGAALAGHLRRLPGGLGTAGGGATFRATYRQRPAASARVRARRPLAMMRLRP